VAFLGRDRTGSNIDFVADGASSATVVVVGVISARPNALGHDDATITTTPQGFAAAGATIPSGATHVRIDVPAGGGDVLYTIDGTTTPTTTNAERLPAGGAGEIVARKGGSLSDVSLRSSTGSVVIACSFRSYT
jgi:hypothetical protein